MFFIDNYYLQTRKRHPALDLPNKEHHKVPYTFLFDVGHCDAPSFF